VVSLLERSAHAGLFFALFRYDLIAVWEGMGSDIKIEMYVDPDVIAEEIVENLEAVLELFKDIVGDLR